MALDEKYAANMRRETGLFATWPLTAPIAIGDFGKEQNGIFQLFGRLSANEIHKLGLRDGASADWDITYQVERGINSKTEARADAGVAEGKALCEIKFKSADGIMFTVPHARITQVTNLAALGRILNERKSKGEWDIDHAVVVEISTAPSGTIILSQQNEAHLQLEVDGKAPVTANVIANLKSENAYLNSRGIGFRIIGEGPLTPLYRLAYLRRRLFRDPNIAYRGDDEKPHEEVDIDSDHVLQVF